MNQDAHDHAGTLTVSEIAELVNGTVRGDGSVHIREVAPIHQALADEIGVLFDRRYLKYVNESWGFLPTSSSSDIINKRFTKLKVCPRKF